MGITVKLPLLIDYIKTMMFLKMRRYLKLTFGEFRRSFDANRRNKRNVVHVASRASVHPGRGIPICCSPKRFISFLPLKGCS